MATSLSIGKICAMCVAESDIHSSKCVFVLNFFLGATDAKPFVSWNRNINASKMITSIACFECISFYCLK